MVHVMAVFNGLANVAAIEVLEEAEILARGHRRHRRLIVDPFEELTDSQFIKMYRLSKPMVEEVVHLVEPYIDPPLTVSGLSVTTKVCTSFFHL